jgi:hypothetical protein
MPAARFGSRASEKMIKTSTTITEKFKFPTDLITLFVERKGCQNCENGDRTERKTGCGICY